MAKRMPRFMRCPKGWRREDATHMPSYPGSISVFWFRTPCDLLVCAALEEEASSRQWLHLSFSRADRMPDYADLQLVRRELIGTDRLSVQFFPAAEEYVNLHNFCLHLWAPWNFEVIVPEQLS